MKRRRADYAETFGTQAGKRVLRDLMQFQVFTTSQVSGDAHQTAFHEGERNVVLYIMGMVQKFTPEELMDEGREGRRDYEGM
jgi:hypothetical protein